MKVLTYVNGELTVINGDNFYKEKTAKPNFITGENFYYEPTLQQMDGIKLTNELKQEAESFIDNFTFPAVVNNVLPVKYYIDKDGNYLGNSPIDNSSVEVPNRPDNIDLKWFNGTWTDCVLIDKTTGYYRGKGDTRTTADTIYAPNTIPTDFNINAYYWDGSTWRVTLEDAQLYKKKEIKDEEVKDIKNIIGFTAYLEPTSYQMQEQEARAYLADNTIATPLIDQLATNRGLGETVEELANKIVQKADAYKVTYGQILGKFQKLIKQIDDATTVDEVKAITW